MIQGPNEVGKSSIAEAINNLLDELDSSSRASIKATKPVNRDVGPEVEIDLTTGPYSVTYAKRWLSKPMTTLTIHKPRAEQLTGRDAHHRMRAILDETLDETLWAALRYQQGQSVAQAALGDSRTLSAALDASASGGALGGDDEDGLWSRIKEHRLEFVTPAGRKSAARLELQDTIDTLTADVEGIARELRAWRRPLNVTAHWGWHSRTLRPKPSSRSSLSPGTRPLSPTYAPSSKRLQRLRSRSRNRRWQLARQRLRGRLAISSSKLCKTLVIRMQPLSKKMKSSPEAPPSRRPPRPPLRADVEAAESRL